MNTIINNIEKEQLKTNLKKFNVGDSVKVHIRVKEGEKERVQVFTGIVISRQGSGINEAFTVRRIAHGEGVERVFPVNSPALEKVEIIKQGKIRRSRLYYLRHEKGSMNVKTAETTKKATAKSKKAAVPAEEELSAEEKGEEISQPES